MAAHKFGVIHMHDVKQTLHNKGVEIEKECRIYEVCNPVRAKVILEKDFKLISGLPCKVSIWEGADGGSEIGLVDAQAILGIINPDPDVIEYATEVNSIIRSIVDATL